ncbi:MAG: hypothetical protein U9Q81_26430 [Pseudomonadota bacterium]|nr:hypothetical protein [Pseudomonadota bacterium]
MRRLPGPVLLLRLLLALSVMGPISAAAEQAELKAQVRASLAAEGPFWVSQAVPLHLDLLSTGFAFGNQRFDLSEVPGALVLQPESTALKLTEQRSGETWQVLRYEIMVFPQRAGTLMVPAIGVAFSVSAGYGQPEQGFKFTTEPLQAEVRLPAGVAEGEPLVTSTNFTLEQSWTPNAEEIKVGDALTRRVVLRAADVPGMALPPMPIPDIAGVALYPKDPQVHDRGDRGVLRGERAESHTLVFQRPGSFDVPGARIRWWNPETQKLDQVEIAPLSIDVAPNPALEAAKPTLLERLNRRPLLVASVLLLLGASVFLAYRSWQPLLSRWRTWRSRRAESETAYFQQLLRVCRRNDPTAAYNALTSWLARWSAEHPRVEDGASLVESDRVIAEQLHLLGRAVAGYEPSWQGEPLGQVLTAWRKAQDQRHTGRDHVLLPLNPRSVRIGARGV